MSVATPASIDLNQVGVFIKVVEAGSFTAAAAGLRLPKSSVSRRVAALEEALGTRLLQRTTRRLALTDAGQRYFQQARLALSGLDEAASELADMGREPRGTVRVTAPIETGEGVLGPVLARFALRYPGIHVDVFFTGRRVNLIEEGFDLAVRAGAMEDSTLVARRVAQADLGLYAARAYLQRRGHPRRLADLASHDCILFRASGGVLPWRLSGPRGPEAVRVSGPFTVDDMGAAQRLAAAGAGIALLPLRLAASMVRLLPGYRVSGGGVYVVSPPLRHVPARVAALRDHLLAELPRAFSSGPR